MWGEWTEFTQCSTTCGGGMRERSRKCDSPQAKHGGLDCFYPHSIQEKGFTVYIHRVKECNPDPCKGFQLHFL